MANSDYESADLITQSLDEFVNRLEKSAEETEETPSEWMEKYFIIPTPRDPITGEDKSPGPIQLADHQKRIINEALSKVNGKFQYSTVLYSAPKKSGKSAVASAVALYMATKTPYGQIYCLANDGKNSKDRLFLPIWRCLNFHKQRDMLHKEARVNLVEAFLANSAHIEAIPCDASGEAGSEPTCVLYSEFWGYIEENKKRLFTEMTLPPTLYGKAIRWIESYAGFRGVSDLLWEMYSLGKEGYPHPDFEDLKGRDGEPVVYVNPVAKMLLYWDTTSRMIWQNEDYYQQEAQILSNSEFQRIHQNQWVSPIGSYIDPSWWIACGDARILPLLEGSNVPCVLSIDAAITGDCAALVLVTRDPFNPSTDCAVRYVKIFKPSPGHPIKIEEQIGKTIRDLAKRFNIVCVAYDNYQLEGMAQNYRRGNVTLTADEQSKYRNNPEGLKEYLAQESRAAQRWYYQFGQQNPRAIADKRLYDMIVARQIHFNPNDNDSNINEMGDEETLAKHLKQAGVKNTGSQMRIEKLADKAHIDAAVALSMAVDRCMKMSLDNRELHMEDLLKLYNNNKITYQQYLDRVSNRTVEAALRDGR